MDLAKAAASVDRLSGGRLVLGLASGDRPLEFPAYGLEHAQRGERFAQGLDYLRQLLHGSRHFASSLATLDDAELLPRPAAGAIPLIVTGSARQTADWLARQADGWLTYPESTVDASGPRRLAGKIRAWRMSIADGGFRPHMTNEWLDLVDDPAYPRTPLHGGYVLRTGRHGLIEPARRVARGGRQPCRPGYPVLRQAGGGSHPGTGRGGAAAVSSHQGVEPASMDW